MEQTAGYQWSTTAPVPAKANAHFPPRDSQLKQAQMQVTTVPTLTYQAQGLSPSDWFDPR